MKYELKHGQALVITGPQGCGKSTLAREIAEKHGTFVETEIAVLEDKFGLADVLHSEPKTLIMDGFPASENDIKRIKSMIANDTVRVHRQYQMPKMVGSPNFIFCSGDANPFPLTEGDRRFYVVHLDGTA